MKLTNFPIPPSINKQLASVNGRLIKTSAAKYFDAKVNLYALKKFREIEKIKELIKEGDLLKVDCLFVFHKKRLIGKKNQIKTLDVNNYLKSALDGLVKCLEIDDKFFISHHVEKLTCEHEHDEQIIFSISKAELKEFKKSELTP